VQISFSFQALLKFHVNSNEQDFQSEVQEVFLQTIPSTLVGKPSTLGSGNLSEFDIILDMNREKGSIVKLVAGLVHSFGLTKIYYKKSDKHETDKMKEKIEGQHI